MDFLTIVLIIIGVTVVVTVMAAGGLRELIPPKLSAPGGKARTKQPMAAPTVHEDPTSSEEPSQAGRWLRTDRGGRNTRSDREEGEDPGDNFFSDEDDFVFREPEHNRGPFSQREEDRDGLEDPDRSR